jgi:hypothetical protein
MRSGGRGDFKPQPDKQQFDQPIAPPHHRRSVHVGKILSSAVF